MSSFPCGVEAVVARKGDDCVPGRQFLLALARHFRAPNRIVLPQEDPAPTEPSYPQNIPGQQVNEKIVRPNGEFFPYQTGESVPRLAGRIIGSTSSQPRGLIGQRKDVPW